MWLLENLVTYVARYVSTRQHCRKLHAGDSGLCGDWFQSWGLWPRHTGEGRAPGPGWTPYATALGFQPEIPAEALCVSLHEMCVLPRESPLNCINELCVLEYF